MSYEDEHDYKRELAELFQLRAQKRREAMEMGLIATPSDSPVPSTGTQSLPIVDCQIVGSEPCNSLPRSRSSSLTSGRKQIAGLRTAGPPSHRTSRDLLSSVLSDRNSIELTLTQKLRKHGRLSRETFQEATAEAAYLAGRQCNSIRKSWDEADLPHQNRPDKLAEWVQDNVSGLKHLTYLGSEKHPQTSYKRARFGGVTQSELLLNKAEFETLYGMEFGSVLARRDYEVLMSGIQHNLRWQPELSSVPMLGTHYRADAGSRTYAIAAQNADTPLLAASMHL